MTADGSVERGELAERQSRDGQSYWSIVRTQFRRNRTGMFGFWVILAIVTLALLSPVIANDKPVVARFKGELVFPALTGYVDSWVPWHSARQELRSLEVGDGWFPLSPHYAALEGRTWKQVAETDDPALTFALWPPIRWHASQFDDTSMKSRPSATHPLGTDDQGRDVLARIVHGCVVAVMVGVVAMGIAAVIGVSLGLLAGFFRGWVDLVLSRVVEIVMVFPTFFLIIAVISFLERSIINIMLVIGLFSWTGIYRLIRGEALKVGSQDYVVAARALGISRRLIMLRHILPNAVAPVFVSVAFGIAGAVLTETSLSFLGFGDASVPSWGEIVSQGRQYLAEGLDHLVIWPGVAIFVTLTAFNLFGQGLRDAMDPRLRH